MPEIQHTLKIVSNERLCPSYYRLSIAAPSILPHIQPGQFIHIRTSPGFEPFFRRPFSVYRAKKYLEIFYEALGPGTRFMKRMERGDDIDVLGPLGRPFTPPKKEIKQVVMIAGGIGIAPFLILTDVLKKKRIELVLLYGARTKSQVYPMKEFKENGCKIFISTDDGSAGVKGRVAELFFKVRMDPDTTFIYTCGPHPMMRAVQEFAQRNNIAGEAACEEVMACALGACLGCSIRTTSGYKTVCYDGPVFDLREVIF